MNLTQDKIAIVNNITDRKSEIIAKQLEATYGMTFKVLENDKYQYVHSLKGERNSGILKSDYPQNYINAVVMESMKMECSGVVINTKDTGILDEITKRTQTPIAMFAEHHSMFGA